MSDLRKMHKEREEIAARVRRCCVPKCKNLANNSYCTVWVQDEPGRMKSNMISHIDKCSIGKDLQYEIP